MFFFLSRDLPFSAHGFQGDVVEVVALKGGKGAARIRQRALRADC